jgi:hypothetical protein
MKAISRGNLDTDTLLDAEGGKKAQVREVERMGDRWKIWLAELGERVVVGDCNRL